MTADQLRLVEFRDACNGQMVYINPLYVTHIVLDGHLDQASINLVDGKQQAVDGRIDWVVLHLCQTAPPEAPVTEATP